jgi:hypothetical protein
MLFDGLPDVALRLLNGLPVAKATGDVWCIGEVPFILGLLLDDDLKGIELHKLTCADLVLRQTLPARVLALLLCPEGALAGPKYVRAPGTIKQRVPAPQAIIRKGGMGRNKTLRHRLATLKRRVQLHEDKERRERRKGRPELGLIEHWQTEIDNWKEQIRHVEARLKRQR